MSGILPDSADGLRACPAFENDKQDAYRPKQAGSLFSDAGVSGRIRASPTLALARAF
jgi:hypothetical protein